jgi:hypothetical protein
MLDVLKTKSLQTSILAALLFYLFANPSTFKMLKKFPGLKFVMKSTTQITQSGVVVNALLFGIVLFLCVYLINSSLIKDHLKFLNVVERMTMMQIRKMQEKGWSLKHLADMKAKGLDYDGNFINHDKLAAQVALLKLECKASGGEFEKLKSPYDKKGQWNPKKNNDWYALHDNLVLIGHSKTDACKDWHTAKNKYRGGSTEAQDKTEALERGRRDRIEKDFWETAVPRTLMGGEALPGTPSFYDDGDQAADSARELVNIAKNPPTTPCCNTAPLYKKKGCTRCNKKDENSWTYKYLGIPSGTAAKIETEAARTLAMV